MLNSNKSPVPSTEVSVLNWRDCIKQLFDLGLLKVDRECFPSPSADFPSFVF